ncbi:MAG: radical SAM protein [Planctomycetes bacterium]|nr:radical SAM protein [Planctomycetota bacterium]
MVTREPTRYSIAQRCNSELSVRALRLGAGRAFHRPTQVYLQLASACNLSCTMCSEANRPEDARHGKGLKSFAPELFARLETEVFPWSSELYFGVGGEPTFSEHFVEYTERAARAGQEIHLVTNGTFLERDAVARVIAAHVAYVQVSIDAATEPTYERIRVGSRWSRLLAGLERLAELRRRAAPGTACHWSLCFVLMRSNVDELPAFVELAHHLGADAVHAQHVIAMTDAGIGESLVGEPERYDAIRARAQARADELGIELDAPLPFEPLSVEARRTPTAAPLDPDLAGHVVPCRSPNQTAVILYDGRVYACCHPMAHQKMQLGDLRVQSFEEVWNGRAARNLRAGIKTGDVPTICRTCSIVHSPPPVAEVAGELETSPGLAEHYGDRDLDAVRSNVPAGKRIVDAYVHDLRRHADELAAERERLVAHAAALQSERDGLARHAANLESDRVHHLAHIANLEAAHESLLAHAWRLSKRLEERGAGSLLKGWRRPNRRGDTSAPEEA